MKIKLFLVTIILTALLYAATNYFFVNYISYNRVESAKNAVSQSVSIYSRISEADKFDKIHKVESIAKNAKLIEAIDPAKWDEVSEEVLSAFAQDALEYEGKEAKGDVKRNELSPNAKAFVDKIETEMNVINQIYDYSNTIFVSDTKGNIIAKNLDGIFKGVNLAGEKLFQTVLRGTPNRDVMKIKGKTYIVSAAPIIDRGNIIGIYFSADNIDNEAAKNAVASLYDESIFTHSQFYFGFFDKTSLLGSTLQTPLHDSFKKFINNNQDLIAKIDEEGSKRHDMEIVLNGETFIVSVSRHPSLSDNEDLFYLSLVSKDKLLKPLSVIRGTFTLLVVFLLIISLVLIYIFDEQNDRPVNKFMEGMLEIINGNIKFRFNNDAKGVEGNLNQNANMMIATILGERMPDKEKPVSIKK